VPIRSSTFAARRGDGGGKTKPDEVIESVDVLVVGGGNAGACAALAAAEHGARVLVVDRSAERERGGNSKYTRNLRCASDAYPEDELFADLISVTGEGIDLALARFAIERSREAPAWMETHGVRWQAAFRGTLHLDRTNRFFLGGGKALLNVYYRALAARGILVRYDTRLVGIEPQTDGSFAVTLATAGGTERLAVRALAIASGGYESNIAWLEREWGEAARQFVIRGTSHNDGAVLQMLFDLGAQKRGNPRGFHSIAVDARSPRYDGGIVTRVDSIPHGIVVNRYAQRFYDEGEMLWPKRYAIWGRLIAEQDGQIAYSIYDARTKGHFVPACFAPVEAATIEALATALQLDPAALVRTVTDYNARTTAGTFDIGKLDGLTTRDLAPAKTNWARPLDTPPYFAYPVRPGITFTYLGVRVDAEARVLNDAQQPIPGIFAAGEVMAGNLLTQGYLGGFGMTIGTVFGRIAGKEAARYAVRHPVAR
jgi:tricarballylate dehydrogenase